MIALIITLRSYMQLNELIPIKPSCELLLHIQLLGVKLSEFAVELVEPTDQVLEVFSQHPHEEHLHIVVDFPPPGEFELNALVYQMLTMHIIQSLDLPFISGECEYLVALTVTDCFFHFTIPNITNLNTANIYSVLHCDSHASGI